MPRLTITSTPQSIIKISLDYRKEWSPTGYRKHWSDQDSWVYKPKDLTDAKERKEKRKEVLAEEPQSKEES